MFLGGIGMYTLAADEKATAVIIYTANGLVRGEVITKQMVRVGIWLRTDAAPEYIHLLRAQVVTLCGVPKVISLPELYLYSGLIYGFHLAPPAEEPLDYDPNEAHRLMLPVNVILGTFLLKCKVRISTQTDFGTSLTTISRLTWLSLYEAEITNPFLPPMGVIKTSMLLVRPQQVVFGLE